MSDESAAGQPCSALATSSFPESLSTWGFKTERRRRKDLAPPPRRTDGSKNSFRIAANCCCCHKGEWLRHL